MSQPYLQGHRDYFIPMICQPLLAGVMCALVAFHRLYRHSLHLHVRCVQGLRLHDNPALLEGAKGAQHMYPIFIIDPHFLRCGQQCGDARRTEGGSEG